MERGPKRIKRVQNERKERSRQINIEKDKAKVRDEERIWKRLSLRKQRKEDQNKRQEKCRQINTEQKRLKAFRESTMFNAMFTCCCCQRNLFKGNVTKFNQKLHSDVETKKPGLYERAIELDSQGQPMKVNIDCESSSYICHACKSHLKSGKLPPMSAMNRLKIYKYDPELELTE